MSRRIDWRPARPGRTPVAVLLLALLVLDGCTAAGRKVVVESRFEGRSQPRVALDDEFHLVQAGDTLWSIAWQRGRDPFELARLNRLQPPHTIYPGQRIRLGDSPEALDPVETAPAPQRSAETSATDGPRKKPRGTAASATAFDSNRRLHWRWPGAGGVIATFDPAVEFSKGIDLDGNAGDPVRAAEAGEVVYSGSGLPGYGKLLIIKHNREYLSAYAHNDRLLVDEGDLVKISQVVARMGDTGTDRVKLHFQIRRRGDPVDPLKLLPVKR